jgi:hypothetical protein
MRKNPIVGALPAVLAMLALSAHVYAQAASPVGKWYVLPDGKSEATTLVLNQSGDSITGDWTPPKGTASPIENGKGDPITFDIVGPKKWGTTREIYAKAARGDME